MTFENLKKYYMDNRLLCSCILLAILFFVNCFVSGFGYLIALVICGLIVAEDRKNGFSIIVFSTPLVGIEEGMGGYIGVLIALTIYLIKNYIIMFFIDKKKINYVTLSIFLVFVIYALLPIGEYNAQMFYSFGAIVYLFLLINIFVRYKDTLNLKFNVSVLAISLIVSSAFFLTYFISPIINDRKLFPMNDDFIRFAAFFTNPNILAMISEICLSFLTYFLIRGKWEWTDILAYIIFSVLGVTTFSKTFLILFAINFFILIVYVLKVYKLKALYVLLGTFVCGVAVILIKKDFFLTYINRFVGGWNTSMDTKYEQVLDIATTGRYKLWTTVLQYVYANPKVLFFGRGLGAPLVASMSAHNFYISLLYELGIVGSLLFIGLIVALVLAYKKEEPNFISKAIVVPITIVALLMCVEDLFLFIYE